MKLSRAFLTCCILVCSGWSGVLAGQPQQAAPAVHTEQVITLNESQPMTYVGSVQGAETVSVVARVSGTLWKASFREGGMV